MTTQAEKTKKKILEPTYRFVVKQVKVGEDYTTDTVPVSELVKAGQVLVDFPHFASLAEKGYEKSPVEAGDFVVYDEQQHSFHSTIYGYPRIKETKKPDIEGFVAVISVEPLLKYSSDNMTVGLNIHPPLDDCYSLRNENLQKLLQDHGIRHGIVASAVEEAEDFLQKEEKEFRTVIVAKGQRPGESFDAYLRFEMEIGPIAGTILPDGSIDFRERKIMVPVHEGEIIATKIPPVQGEPGIDVFGEEIPAREGKDIKIALQNDAKFSAEDLKVYATKDGVLSIVNKNTIKVCSHQVIHSDIDYETGNVESMNSVTVQGSVQPGFKVFVKGELKVTGSVMSASLGSESNLVIQGGITGKNSTVTASGDADINFIEQGKITAGGSVIIRKQSYYSEIIAGKDIRCHQSSIVLGGRMIAEGSITLGEVGGENSAPSVIAAGVVAERLNHFAELKKSIVQQQDDIIQWLQLYRGSSRSKKVRNMEKELDNSKQLLLHINMVPGSGQYSRVATTDPEQKNHPDYLDADAIDIGEVAIDVHGTILAGTELQIGNVTMRLDKTVSGRSFKLNRNLKRIVAAPLKKKK